MSTLYRTHKSLSRSGKISSLYVFDALSRAARNQVNKQGLTGDLSSALGNCATFLLKVEGVLDGLFQDMVTLSHPDSKVSYGIATDMFPLLSCYRNWHPGTPCKVFRSITSGSFVPCQRDNRHPYNKIISYTEFWTRVLVL